MSAAGTARVGARRTGRGACLVLVGGLGACTVVGTTTPPPPVTVRVGAAPVETREPVPVSLNPVRSFDEVRAVWVVRFTMTTPEAVREMVRTADASGFNTLIVQVRGRADAFYASELEPPGEALRREPPFDPLALTIEEAHARGMAVHAWVNTHLVWGPTEPPESPEHLVNAHPDWLGVPRELARELAPVDPFEPRYAARLIRYARDNPSSVEGVYTSPSHPEVHDRVHSVWMDLARRYDLDGIHFDYIRFPNARYDYSVGALERFRFWLRTRLPEDRFRTLDAEYADDLLAFVDGEQELWGDFRREHVTRLVERIRRDVRAEKPRMIVSAAVIADADLAYRDRFQPWKEWLRDGLIDVAVPMAYTADPDRFEELVADARSAAPASDRVWAGIGAYMNSPGGTLEMIDIARERDAGGIVLFSYDWAVAEGQDDPSGPLLDRIARERFGR